MEAENELQLRSYNRDIFFVEATDKEKMRGWGDFVKWRHSQVIKDLFIRFPAVVHEPKLKHLKANLINMGEANITNALDCTGIQNFTSIPLSMILILQPEKHRFP
jgi:hypothetical protein